MGRVVPLRPLVGATADQLHPRAQPGSLRLGHQYRSGSGVRADHLHGNRPRLLPSSTSPHPEANSALRVRVLNTQGIPTAPSLPRAQYSKPFVFNLMCSTLLLFPRTTEGGRETQSAREREISAGETYRLVASYTHPDLSRDRIYNSGMWP